MAQRNVIAFRCDEAFRARIRRHAERLQTHAPAGLKVAEADAVRDLVLRGLAGAEPPAKKRKTSKV